MTLRTSKEMKTEREKDVCQSSPCHFYLFCFFFLNEGSTSPFSPRCDLSDVEHGTEIMLATPKKSHQCHHKPVKKQEKKETKKIFLQGLTLVFLTKNML